MTTADDIPLPRLPARGPDSHKGDFGRAVLIGGSRGMTGAIALAGLAALRGGAGLVQLAVPADCQAAVAVVEPSYMTAALPGDADGQIVAAARDKIDQLCEHAAAVALGPGLGRSHGLDVLVAELYRDLPKPLVLDADALNALATRGDLPRELPAPRVLTPHPGEFARLIKRSVRNVQAAREELAHDYAARHGVVLVLKGHCTVISDGRQTAVNTTGNPGMATGGSGDVLTGVVTALLSQGLPPYDAARLGVHVHGLAGDLAADELGQVSLIASDLIRFLPAAFKTCS